MNWPDYRTCPKTWSTWTCCRVAEVLLCKTVSPRGRLVRSHLLPWQRRRMASPSLRILCTKRLRKWWGGSILLKRWTPREAKSYLTWHWKKQIATDHLKVCFLFEVCGGHEPAVGETRGIFWEACWMPAPLGWSNGWCHTWAVSRLFFFHVCSFAFFFEIYHVSSFPAATLQDQCEDCWSKASCSWAVPQMIFNMFIWNIDVQTPFEN